ncbi:MAG: hypothetical protein CMP48_19865 [Rickettsiales bacterium]|nr:hypothetical protein [Rickettsiales bacterium]
MVASNLFDLPQAIILSNQTEQSWSDSLFEFLNLPKYSKPCFSTFYDQIHADDLEGVQNIYRHLDHWYNGRSKQLTFRIKCPINGYKWITNIMQSQVFPDKQLIITSRFFDANVVKRGSMSLHQIQQQLERADPLSADPDIQYNPDLVDKVTQFTRIGWFEYYIPDSRTVYSSSIKPMVGLDDQDRFTAEYFKSIVEKESWEKAMLFALDAKPSDPILNQDVRVLVKGEQKWFNVQLEFTFVQTIITRIFGVVQDVTELRETQDKLERAQQISNTGWYEYDVLDHSNSRFSDSWLTIHDFEQGDKPSWSEYLQKVRPLDHEGIETNLEAFLDKFGSSWDKLEFKIIDRQEKERYISNSSRVIFEEGLPVKVFGICRDITESKNFEEQLILSNNDLDALIRATDNLIFVIDEDCRFERVIGTEERFHIPTKDFIGNKVADIWTDPNGIEMTQMVERALTEQVGESLDCMHINRKGEIEWLMVTTHPYKGYDHKNRVSVVIEEITQQKKFEQELQKTLELERELSKMRSNFVAMASHQFRTPLTVIKSNMQLLEAVDIQHPMLDRISARLIREVDRLVDLMEDILLIGKAQTNNMRVDPITFNLDTLIDDIIKDIDQITDDGRTLRLNRCGESVEFTGDYHLLRHALINIVTNAFKYSKGQPNPELTVDYTLENSIQVTVRDYGIGIPNEDHERIFNDFYRGNNVKDIPGTGLGMSITREFLKLNNGTIELESELGLGSSFLVKLPKAN